MGRLAIGHRQGQLEVLDHKIEDGRCSYICQCVCGKFKKIADSNIRRVQSCGCLRQEASRQRATTHGKSDSQIWRAWSNMKDRCNREKNPHFHNYGGRGIKVSDSWRVFENFLADIGDPPTPQHTLERIDNGRGYEKDNCRWSDRASQANNRRSSVKYDFKGKKLSLAEICRLERKNLKTVDSRIRLYGYTLEEALNEELFKPVTYSFAGEQLRLKDISRKVGVKYPNLYKKVVLQRKDLLEAIGECQG